LPVAGIDGVPMSVSLAAESELMRRHRAALRETCTDLEAAHAAKRDAVLREDALGYATAMYDGCALDRFGLVDRDRFALSNDAVTTIAAYDHMVRQGADPTLAGALVDELFWQSPWPFSAELVERLPDVDGGWQLAGGIGVRITRAGLADDPDGVHVPPAVLEALAAVRPSLIARYDGELVRLVLVADADAPMATMAALANDAIDSGADEVVALVEGGGYGLRSVRVVSRRSADQPATRHVCVDGNGAWELSSSAQGDGSAARGQPFERAAARRPWQRFADVMVVSSTQWPTLLATLAAMQGPHELGEPDLIEVGRIAVMRDIPDCAGWFDAIAAADVDARSLHRAMVRCEGTRAEPRSRRRDRALAACRLDVCTRARDHVARFSAVPDVGEREGLVSWFCDDAPASGPR
jgi:hypothetical protein